MELELELIRNRKQELPLSMLQELLELELEEEAVEEFQSMVLDSLELVKFRNCRGLVVPHCWKLMPLDCWKLMVPNCRELVEFQDCWERVEFRDCWELVEFQVIEAEEDPLLLVIEVGEGPQVMVALEALGRLLSYCFQTS